MMSLIVLALLFCLGGLASAAEPEIPNFPKIRYSPDFAVKSEGFLMGYFRYIDWSGYFSWSYEGQLALGIGTQPGKIVDHLCAEAHPEIAATSCVIGETPWHFSFIETPLYNQYQKLLRSQNFASPVVIYFEVPLYSPTHFFLRTGTKNFLMKIYRVSPRAMVRTHYELDRSSLPAALRGLNRGVSTIPQGWVVAAVLDNVIFKTYVITIQENLEGNNFMSLNVNDPEMFDFLVTAMLSGRPVRISYLQLQGWDADLFKARGYQTPFRIIGVDILQPASTIQ